MRKRILIPILLTSIPASLLAQIFGPTIVFDPTVSGRVLTEIAQIVKLYKTALRLMTKLPTTPVGSQIKVAGSVSPHKWSTAIRAAFSARPAAGILP